MRVFYEDELVINIEDDCPSLQGFIDRGAEEIPLEIFNNQSQYADNSNTRQEGGVWVFDGYVAPPPTDYELKLQGVEIEGVMCSATKEDMWGLNAVLSAIQMGASTDFRFDNGTVLEITPTNNEAIMAVWMPFRLSFFN